jgi:hypothetical protein
VHFVLPLIGSTPTRANEKVFICRRCKPHYAFLDLHLLTEASPKSELLIAVPCARWDKMQSQEKVLRVGEEHSIRSTVAVACKIPLLRLFLSGHF